MADIYLKLSGGTELTSYIKAGGYAYTRNPQEISDKIAASGFRTRKIGENKVGWLTVTFRAGLTAAQVSTILTTLDVSDKGLFEFWDSTKNKARKAYFYVTMDKAKLKYSVSDVYDSFTVDFEQADTASDVAETIVSSFPSAFVDKSGTWTNETNAYADDGSYCTNAGATNANQVIYYSGFAWLDGEGTPVTIPAGAILNYIDIEMEYKVSTTTSHIGVAFIPAYKNVERGTLWRSENEPTSDEVVTARFSTKGWTVDQIESEFAQIKIGYNRYSATACTLSIDYVKMIVSYTEAD